MTQGYLGGTGMGEAIRFFGQFKAFPLCDCTKSFRKRNSYFKGPNKDLARGIVGLGSIIVTSGLFRLFINDKKIY
jgi:hypothetical protein